MRAGRGSFQILLATLNGARFLEEQIESLERQTLGQIHILASDDGSDDDTLILLERARSRWTKGRFEIISGPGMGFARNFRHLIEQAPRDADFYAFCDQDDIWHADKLQRAVEACALGDATRPFAFGSASALIDAQGRSLGQAPRRRGGPGIRNAVIQNIASGHTMVTNREGFALLADTAASIGPFPHDHWLYLIIEGTGGRFHLSSEPTVDWRQHQDNAIGARIPPFYRPRRSRFERLRRGKLRGRMMASIALLDEWRDLLTDEAKEVVDQCRVLDTCPNVLTRMKVLHRAGLYRTSFTGQIGLWLDFLLNFKVTPSVWGIQPARVPT
ncbi:glycosyltransferase [Qipengyuania sp. YG27]|uniref:Glycosyltransferase n=1 Tax=Qipengyuania mesophila TaxID=2867246 RepID=A0ABS7JXJ9_9SPHN|nr:glycosyltransferase [Qipengyuania mesophila]